MMTNQPNQRSDSQSNIHSNSQSNKQTNPLIASLARELGADLDRSFDQPKHATLTYEIYLLNKQSNDRTIKLSINQSLDDLEAFKQRLLQDFHNFIQTTCPHGYLWNKQSFNLSVNQSNAQSNKQSINQSDKQSNNQLICLKGETVFGDCQDDEYLIVKFLQSVDQSNNQSNNQTVLIHFYDNDGDFLLIDVADKVDINRAIKESATLSSQNQSNNQPNKNSNNQSNSQSADEFNVDPSTMANRFWLIDGSFGLIGPNICASNLETTHQAISLIIDELQSNNQSNKQTKLGRFALPDELQAALTDYLSIYPDQSIKQSNHQSNSFLPISAALILQHDQSNNRTINQSNNQSILSCAIDTFDGRDLIDMRAANRMQALMPNNQSVNQSNNQSINQTNNRLTSHTMATLAPCPVRLTRLMFAKLFFHSFVPPRSLLQHPAIQSINQSINQSIIESEEFSFGMKLTAALEMYIQNLYRKRDRSINQSINQTIKQTTRDLSDQDLAHLSLIDNVLQQAALVLSNNQSINQSNNQTVSQLMESDTDRSVNQTINQSINQLFNQSLRDLPVSDDCSWMAKSRADFQAMMDKQSNKQSNKQSDDETELDDEMEDDEDDESDDENESDNESDDEEPRSSASQLINQLYQFINQSSGIDGIETQSNNQTKQPKPSGDENKQSTNQSKAQSNNQSTNQSNHQSNTQVDPSLDRLFALLADADDDFKSFCSDQSINQSNNQISSEWLDMEAAMDEQLHEAGLEIDHQSISQSNNQSIDSNLIDSLIASLENESSIDTIGPTTALLQGLDLSINQTNNQTNKKSNKKSNQTSSNR